jgi:hypothetical protein
MAGTSRSRYCASKQFGELRNQITPQRTLAQVFDETGATLLADESSLSDPLTQEFLAQARQLHWDVLAERHLGGSSQDATQRAATCGSG